MRDIRGDLQERADLLEQQINSAQAHFDKLIEELKREQEGRLGDLTAELEAVNRVSEIEQRRLGNAMSASKPEPQPWSQQPPPQQPLANFLIHKLGQVGLMSSEDLCHLAVQEGYFAGFDSAKQGVHAMLKQVVKAGHIQQLPNSYFAASVSDQTKLRRVV